METIEVIIDHESLERSKKIFSLIRKQLLEDHIVNESHHMRTEDADIATTVCLLTNAFTIKKKEK